MKKTILILSILLTHLQAFALEDYLIISESPVSSIIWDDDSIISAAPVTTIDNKKTSIILKSKNIGTTVLTIDTDEGRKTVDVIVSKDKTILSDTEGLSYFPLDFPVEGK